MINNSRNTYLRRNKLRKTDPQIMTDNIKNDETVIKFKPIKSKLHKQISNKPLVMQISRKTTTRNKSKLLLLIDETVIKMD